MMKKGYYFTFDAFFGTVLLLFGIVVASQFFIEEEAASPIDHMSKDIITSLSNIKINEINDTWVKTLIANNEVTNENNSVIEQIGEFYVLNRTEHARNLSRLVIEKLVPDKFGIEIRVNDEIMVQNASAAVRNDDLVSFRRLVSGLEKFKAIKGATSKVYLEGFSEKREYSYVYFGGFIGQGNITMTSNRIPSDADLMGLYMELDAGANFRLKVNDVWCGGTYTPILGNMTTTAWNISSCLGSLNAGTTNQFDIIFNSLLNVSYIAGGYIRMEYLTSEFTPFMENATITYNFPEINGIVNLYDAFYVPGTVTAMNIYLHFTANDTSYLTIGGRQIHEWQGSNNSQQTYNITNANLSTADYDNLYDDYDLFSNNTVPIRFASYEEVIMVLTGGNADVVIITDLSGSMKKSVADWTLGNSAPTCSNYQSNPDTRRTRAAVCVDKESVNVVMNYSGNRMWPVYIRDNAISYFNDPTNKNAILADIDSYYNDQGKDKTCLACSINKAYDIFNTYSTGVNRSRFVILMTDGVPTHCASGSCYSNSTVFGTQQCEGLCDTSGGCGSSDIGGQCSACTTNNGGSINAIYAANRTYKKFNATFFTVGFGPVDDCPLAPYVLSAIANLSNGSFQMSRSTAELHNIYQNISYEILEQIEQYQQEVNFKGNLSKNRSIMYGDSYIQVDYIPFTEGPKFDEIAISFETDKFTSCTPTVSIPNELRVIDARVTSYSGSHWTDALYVNNFNVFNLSDYLMNYVRVGDPFFVYIPVNHMNTGDNTLRIRTGDTPENGTGCSFNNTLIYTGLVTSSVAYSDVLPYAEGCTWDIEFDDLDTTTMKIPPSYAGTKQCYYTNASISYDVNDTYDDATFQLMDSLDFDNDGRIFLNLESQNLVVDALSVGKIPYPWGPAVTEVRVWK